MEQEPASKDYCEPSAMRPGCCKVGASVSIDGCKVEALISIDERGQMILPKEIRDKANIRAGDKLAVTSWEKDGKIFCISLTRAEELTEMVKGILGPVMRELL
jgi:antitoxin PrlF